MTEKKLYLYCCVAGAYTVAFIIDFSDIVYELAYAVVTDFSIGTMLALLSLPVHALTSAVIAIPHSVLGMFAGIPGIAGGYAAARKLRARGITGLWTWLGAGACIGAANAALVLLLIPERMAGLVMGPMMAGAAFAAFYLWRADRERAFLNRR